MTTNDARYDFRLLGSTNLLYLSVVRRDSARKTDVISVAHCELYCAEFISLARAFIGADKYLEAAERQMLQATIVII